METFLPHELIVQILLRLPVKSLIRFKYVCKSWFSLISDPEFANEQFELTQTRRILFISTSPLETRSVYLQASLHDVSALRNLKLCSPLSYSHLKIKGSCRGFILLHCNISLYLWNPSTGVQKIIPLSPFCSDLHPEDIDFYGFGYDPSTDDYLVVSWSTDRISNSQPYLWLFSSRANVWKKISFTTHLPFYTNASYFDPIVESLFSGAIHWLAYSYDICDHVIVSFHLTEMKLLEIPLPADVDYGSQNLWVFRGFLSLWVLDDDTVDLWVMGEYEVHSSWTKTLVLPINHIDYFYPICCTKSGDIIVTDGGGELLKYNNKGEFLERNSYCKDAHRLQLAMYTESLLSLPVHGDNHQAYEDDTNKKNEEKIKL